MDVDKQMLEEDEDDNDDDVMADDDFKVEDMVDEDGDANMD